MIAGKVTVGKRGKDSSRQNVDCVFVATRDLWQTGLSCRVWVNIKPSLPTLIYQEMNSTSLRDSPQTNTHFPN